jgi:hypothetical protein
MALDRAEALERIEAAASYAVQHPLQTPNFYAGSDAVSNVLASYAPEDSVGHLFAAELGPPLPSSVGVDTLEDYTVVLNALRPPYMADSVDVRRTLEHEAAHGLAALKVGFRAVRYEIQFRTCKGVTEYVPTTVMAEATEELTLLGMVAIDLAPPVASDGDIRSVFRRGFKGTMDVGDQIAAHNERAGFDALPLPPEYVNAKRRIAATKARLASMREARPLPVAYDRYAGTDYATRLPRL